MASAEEELAEQLEAAQLEERPSRPPPPTVPMVEEFIDVTKELKEACATLAQGEMAMHADFTLQEAMSAIELMDPKMDGGVKKLVDYISVEDAVAEGWLKIDDAELLATVDATLACLVSWLEGGFLTQTLHTNLLITDPDVLSAACMCNVEGDQESAPSMVMRALAHGLAHTVNLIRHAVGTAAVFEEEDLNLQMPLPVMSSLSMDETEKQLKIVEKSLTAMAKAESARAPILETIVLRLTWVRCFNATLENLVVPREEDLPDGGESFRPNLREAAENAAASVDAATKFVLTSELGKMGPNGQDGNYAWLTKSFIPDLNRRYLPPAFPRKTEILTRRIGLGYLERLSRRLYEVATMTSMVSQDISTMMQYLRTFCEIESCALSRAVLQLVLLPNDEHIMGDVHLQEILRESIKNAVAPPFMFKDSPSARSQTCLSLFEEFLGDAVRVYLMTIQALGHNLGKQRDKVAMVLEDFAQLQLEAERVDSEVTAITNSEAESSKSEVKGPAPGPHISTFMLQQSCRLIQWHFELGFRLQLFADYEYAFIFWYMRDVVCKWLLSSSDRSEMLLISNHQAEISVLQKKENMGRGRLKQSKINKLDEKLRKRLELRFSREGYVKGEEAIYTGYYHVCFALTARGDIKIPEFVPGESEKLRTLHRVAFLEPYGAPLYLEYADFRKQTRYDELMVAGPLHCFQQAARMFESARQTLEEFTHNPRLLAAARICRQNVVVCKIMASGMRPNAKVQFDFTDKSFPCYPLLKLV